MPAIEYTSIDFPADHPKVRAGVAFETFNWDDLLWAAVTVGRGSLFEVIKYGDASAYEIMFRACLLRSTLQSDGNLQRFISTESFRNLDPSEKGAASYFMGLAMCKLFAERFLDVGWLMHLDVYRSQLNTVLKGRSRPDLVGRSLQGKWIVFESKGRSTGPNTNDKTRAKTQATRLTMVDQQPVAFGVALFSYFYRNQLLVHWQDPKPGEDDVAPFKLDVRGKDLLEHYYQPLTELAGEKRIQRQLENGEPIRIQEGDFDLFFEPKVADCLLRKDFGFLYRMAANLQLPDDAKVAGKPSYKRDGIYIRAGASWNRTTGQQILIE